jgi:hypothetical protein
MYTCLATHHCSRSRNMVHFPWYRQTDAIYGRLAQWLERLFYTQDVGGSNPSPPTSVPFQHRLASSLLRKLPLLCQPLRTSKRRAYPILRLAFDKALACLFLACFFRHSSGRLLLALAPVKVQQSKHQQNRTRNKNPKREHLRFPFSIASRVSGLFSQQRKLTSIVSSLTNRERRVAVSTRLR